MRFTEGPSPLLLPFKIGSVLLGDIVYHQDDDLSLDQLTDQLAFTLCDTMFREDCVVGWIRNMTSWAATRPHGLSHRARWINAACFACWHSSDQ